MGEQEPHQLQQEEQDEQLNQLSTDSSTKRKLQDTLELVKQKTQQLASRLVNDADSKRQRLEQNETVASHPNPFPTPPPSFPVASQYYGLQGATTKRISIPNGKVGVVIGKGGETIKYVQLQSGARIQITKDQEADPHSLTRDVELTGTSEQISRAEQLINDVISETDLGGSASSAAQGLNAKQSGGGEQLAVRVPNDKVGLLIGKGGETIKYMQSKSGAHMQIIPLHLPPGDPSTERTVYISGSAEQIEAAKELVNDVISGKRVITPSVSNTYAQQVYTMPGNWTQQGQPPMQQQPQYGYTQTGPSYYDNYNSEQQAWDQSNLSTISQTPQQAAGYGYYGQQPHMASAPLNPCYGYSQTPVAGNTYDQTYVQQPTICGQNISSQAPAIEQQKSYATSSYGMDGTISSQSSHPLPAYPPLACSQSITNPQAYWGSSSFSSQPTPQTGYDQAGYPQTAYGGPQPLQVPPTQPVYEQGGYPPQPTPALTNYPQGAHPLDYGQQPELETQSQSQPAFNGSAPQSLAYGVEISNGSNTANGSNPDVQEVVPSQS